MNAFCTRIARASAVAAATASAVIAWTFMHEVSGIDLAVRAGESTQPVGVLAVAISALLSGLAGWGLLALLERSAKHPRRIWVAVAVTVFVLSLLGPLGGIDRTATLALMGLHATVAAALIIGMARTVGRPA